MSDRDVNQQPVNFDTPRLAEAVGALSPGQVDALPFGAIKINAGDEVTMFSAAEHRLSGYRNSAIGLSFFTDIAPCMNNAAFKGRIDQARGSVRLDLSLTHVGDFNDKEKVLRVRAQSADDGGCWIFIQRDG